MDVGEKKELIWTAIQLVEHTSIFKITNSPIEVREVDHMEKLGRQYPFAEQKSHLSKYMHSFIALGL